MEQDLDKYLLKLKYVKTAIWFALLSVGFAVMALIIILGTKNIALYLLSMAGWLISSITGRHYIRLAKKIKP